MRDLLCVQLTSYLEGGPLMWVMPLHLRGLYRDFRDTGYLPFYFQGYRILSILLPGTWDTMINILVTFRDIEYLGKLIMGIFASL